MGRNNKEQEEEENNNNKSKDVYIETKKSKPQQKVVFFSLRFCSHTHTRTFTLIHSLTHSLTPFTHSIHSLHSLNLTIKRLTRRGREREREKK